MEGGVCFEDGKKGGEEGNRMARRALETSRTLRGRKAM
jgi:hypothetical protein